MSLVEEIKAYLDEDPDGVWELAHNLDIAFVETQVHDERRWYNVKHTVFQRKNIVSQNPVRFEDEYVLVEHCEPATEMQEGGDFPEPVVFPVEPYTVEVVRFKPC